MQVQGLPCYRYTTPRYIKAAKSKTSVYLKAALLAYLIAKHFV